MLPVINLKTGAGTFGAGHRIRHARFYVFRPLPVFVPLCHIFCKLPPVYIPSQMIDLIYGN